jgi:hypothetical protein
MKPLYRGIAVGVLQCLLVLSLAGKYAYDRQTLPRAWAKAVPFDPDLAIRGRYLSLRLEVDAAPAGTGPHAGAATLAVRNGQLVAEPSAFNGEPTVIASRDGTWTTWEPVAFFIPEHAQDPSRLPPGQELWVEVSVPRRGPPLPIRLAVKKDGVLTPLDLR